MDKLQFLVLIWIIFVDFVASIEKATVRRKSSGGSGATRDAFQGFSYEKSERDASRFWESTAFQSFVTSSPAQFGYLLH